MIRTTIVILVLAMTLPGLETWAQDRSWACDGGVDGDHDEIKAIATNISIYRILQEYRDRWDAKHIREQCEAFAAGEPYEISCLDDRRDWEAIKSMVPDELFDMSTKELRPHYVELQEANNGHKAAIDYCRRVGAID